MKHGVISFSSVFVAALFAAPLAWADVNPDFDDDAKPILRQQPGLLHYVESQFEVKDTGTAKFPGDDDHRPGPPYIFRARPIGTHGSYSLSLLIQPGPPGHILGIVDMTKVHLTAPSNSSAHPFVANRAPAQPAPAPQIPARQAPAPAQQPSEPTSDTPSGPIMDSGSSAPDAQPSPQPNLAPPPDSAPATH